MTETEPSAIAINIHRRLFDDIEFSKRRQWVITNYVVLVYAGIFYLAGHFQEHPTFAKITLTLLALVVGGYAAWLLWSIQKDMGRYRTKLEIAHKAWLTDKEKALLEPFQYPFPTWRHVLYFLSACLASISLV